MSTFLTGLALALALAVAGSFGQQLLDESTPSAFYSDYTYPPSAAALD